MSPSPFLQALREHMLTRRYGKRTIDTYLYWVRYYIRYHGKRHPAEMGAEEVLSFLNFLAVHRQVAISTQKIALNALAYLYNKYLGLPLGSLGEFNKSRQPRKLPVVLTRAEVSRLLKNLSGSPGLLASLLYGSGLRRIEAIRLRVKDVDFDHLQLRVWAGKGNKHRITTLAPELIPALRRQIRQVALLHEQDLATLGYTGVWLPHALARKYPSASRRLGWHYLFPSTRLSLEPGTKNLRRHHVDESSINKILKRATRERTLARKLPAIPCDTHSPRTCWSRCGYSYRAGATGVSGCEDHGDLHPCAVPWRARGG